MKRTILLSTFLVLLAYGLSPAAEVTKREDIFDRFWREQLEPLLSRAGSRQVDSWPREPGMAQLGRMFAVERLTVAGPTKLVAGLDDTRPIVIVAEEINFRDGAFIESASDLYVFSKVIGGRADIRCLAGERGTDGKAGKAATHYPDTQKNGEPGRAGTAARGRTRPAGPGSDGEAATLSHSGAHGYHGSAAGDGQAGGTIVVYCRRFDRGSTLFVATGGGAGGFGGRGSDGFKGGPHPAAGGIGGAGGQGNEYHKGGAGGAGGAGAGGDENQQRRYRRMHADSVEEGQAAEPQGSGGAGGFGGAGGHGGAGGVVHLCTVSHLPGIIRAALRGGSGGAGGSAGRGGDCALPGPGGAGGPGGLGYPGGGAHAEQKGGRGGDGGPGGLALPGGPGGKGGDGGNGGPGGRMFMHTLPNTDMAELEILDLRGGAGGRAADGGSGGFGSPGGPGGRGGRAGSAGPLGSCEAVDIDVQQLARFLKRGLGQ